MLTRMVSRVRELTLPKEERQAARAQRRERENEKIVATREAAVRAESHSRHSGGSHTQWRD